MENKQDKTTYINKINEIQCWCANLKVSINYHLSDEQKEDIDFILELIKTTVNK